MHLRQHLKLSNLGLLDVLALLMAAFSLTQIGITAAGFLASGQLPSDEIKKLGVFVFVAAGMLASIAYRHTRSIVLVNRRREAVGMGFLTVAAAVATGLYDATHETWPIFLIGLVGVAIFVVWMFLGLPNSQSRE